MPKLKLTYFDLDGGRGEPARLALHIAGIAFEDRRIGFNDWDGVRDHRRLTVGDLKVWMMVRWLRSGVLDHMPKDLVDRTAPLLVKHAERLAAQPKIAAYYKGRKQP